MSVRERKSPLTPELMFKTCEHKTGLKPTCVSHTLLRWMFDLCVRAAEHWHYLHVRTDLRCLHNENHSVHFSVCPYVQAVYCWGAAGLLGSWWTLQCPKCENNACGNSPFQLLAGGLLPPRAASYDINKREKDSSWRELINAEEVEEMATQVAKAGTAMEE